MLCGVTENRGHAPTIAKSQDTFAGYPGVLTQKFADTQRAQVDRHGGIAIASYVGARYPSFMAAAVVQWCDIAIHKRRKDQALAMNAKTGPKARLNT